MSRWSNYTYTQKERNKAAVRKYYVKRTETNRRLVLDIKKTPCMDCGKRYPPEVMEFDHIPTRGTKELNVSTASYKVSTKRLLKEIEKCDLVCANCHRIRTFYGDEWIYE